MRRALPLALLCLACSASVPDDELPATRQRVLLITVDTLRADHLSAAGHPLETTPFIDSLAAGGMRFSGAFAPVPRTTPTLASVLTGAYPHTTEVRTLTDRLSDEVVTLPERLLERGFRTVAVVSNHMLVPERALDRGFEVYDFADDARDAAGTTAAALEHADALDPEERVFFWVHYIDPHVPYYPPEELARAFDPGYEGRYALHFGSKPGGIGRKAYPEDLPKEQAVYRNTLPDEVNAHVRRLYAADVRHTDDQIRRLVTGLRERLGDEWLIVLTADHGESLGEHAYHYDHGEYVYNASLRVPLIVAPAPGDPLGEPRTIDGWVSLVDLAPTLAELLHVPERADWQLQQEGRSLVPALAGEELPPAPVFAVSGQSYFPHSMRRRVRFDLSGRFRAVIDGRHKLIWTPGARGPARFELYDIVSDPDERQDLSSERPEVRARLERLLAGWVKRGGGARAVPASDADRERLRALGYVE